MSHVRKPRLIESRLRNHAAFVAADPCTCAGHWRELREGVEKLQVDLGCGKGIWTTRAAYANPTALMVGIDIEPMCVSFAAERAAIGGVESSGQSASADSGFTPAYNTVFTIGSAADLVDFFAPGEIDVLHLNFPTPFPRKKETLKRVTCIDRLMEYRKLLGAGGEVRLKTDHQPLFDYTIEQLVCAGYDITWQTRDLLGDDAAGKGAAPSDLLQSGYEERLVAAGAYVHAAHAVVGTAPEGFSGGELMSLYEYLPNDLESISYVPLGMEDALFNMRNRRRAARARASTIAERTE